ncbi:uncharacterized protein LOC6578009 [Drosophila mojavensis]|uniref:uncharacterized protein LOC6578009 n=1 Tax=Drosophila mojavensis TaxID=7230 RepID=UPI001CD06861|nr:uncharacterized protein LOC6578009 [Drosophila mojavensis]
MDDEDEGDFLPPANTNTFAIPREPDLLVEYELYNPSMATRRLHSERNRLLYTEAFIENERLGTLSDLCVRALAKLGCRFIPPQVRQDPLKMRIFYDALDVNMPLQDCYFVEDLRFWRRVVLAKSSNKSLSLKKIDEYDWKGNGVSLKYVELVEACPAAYWPEQKMASLGQLVRPYVRTLHIKHLQSLTDDAFQHFVESESELDVTSEESGMSEISSDERDTPEESEEEGEEEEQVMPAPPPSKAPKITGSSVRIAENLKVQMIEANDSSTQIGLYQKSPSTIELDLKRKQARAARNAARQQLRELRAEKRAEHERRKRQRSLLRKKPEPEPKSKKKKKKAKAGPVDDVFNMDVPPEPPDGEDKKPDGRNIEKLLRRYKRYDYPAKHCHHIDLSFVRYFDHLVSLTIEFLGPEMGRNYHKRHMNFSYDDMVHLGKGLQQLSQLKVFRLRNSRMDHIKLLILARVLKQLDALEVVDFGYDQLTDQSKVAIEMLLERTHMLKALELEYNRLERTVIVSIGQALKYHAIQNPDGAPLEYLGLAHNPINEMGFSSLINDIIGTRHVQELNINGIDTVAVRLAPIISTLLRAHSPLRSLDMAAIKLNSDAGHTVICGLQTNHKVTHFDCRACCMDEEQEYEADIIVRRNNFELQHTYLGDETQTEESLLKFLAGLRHPILTKIDYEMARRDECIINRRCETSSENVASEEQGEEQVQEDFDIWTMFGVQKTSAPENLVSQSETFSNRSDRTFVYNSNAFNLQQIREHLYLPGPENRYFYFQRQKEMFNN